MPQHGMDTGPYIIGRHETAVLKPRLHTARPIKPDCATWTRTNFDPLAEVRIEFATMPRRIDQRANVFIDSRGPRHLPHRLAHCENDILRKDIGHLRRVVAFSS